MVGKHIFVRCRNEQGNAGTWTAAVTERIADKDVIRNHIEPRCNVDETFAQEALMTCPTNSILRLYYANPATLVVSRSFWVTDRITEAMGRKGAYSTSYILTGDDVPRFYSDYTGAFDPSCFESYDDLVARIASNDNKITVNETCDLFSHAAIPTDPSVLARCNFTKDSFVAFMSALYDAVENRRQVAVILPKALRDAWVERGDTTADQAGHFVLSLLPDFMRVNCGMVSHWNCQINDKMVSDMQLLFVHPRNDEDIALLRREGAHIIDLDSGRFTTEIKRVAADYFAFVWDNLDRMERVEDFWAYCKSNYRKLLRGRPTSASAMESIYLIRTITEADFADPDKGYRALRLAAYEFAGAGTRVPMADAFLTDAINKLGLTEKPVDDNTEAFLRHLMSADGEKTSHQHQEYQLLLTCVEAGTAKPETVSALCAELTKDGRDADSYFLSYLTDKVALPAEQITPQLTQLVSGIFLTTFQGRASATSANMLQTIFGIVETWTEKLLDSADSWQPLVMPFAEVYATYIKTEERNAPGLKAAYSFLFLMRALADTDLREKCAKVMLKEEVRIYRTGNTALLNDGTTRFSVFASSFLEQFPLMADQSVDVLAAGYEQLFRILFNPERTTADASLSAYERVTEQLLASHPSAVDKISQQIFGAEERALRDKPPIWNAANTEQAILLVESANLRLMPDYVPSEERLSVLVAELSVENHSIYPLFVEYISRAPFNARQYTYSILNRTKMLASLFVHILFHCDSYSLLDEIATVLVLPHNKNIYNIFSFNFFDGSEDAIRRFSAWYEQELERTLFASSFEANVFSAQQHALVMNEWQLLKSVETFSKPLTAIALEIFAQISCRLYNLIARDEIDALPAETIRDIVRLQSNIITSQVLTHKDAFEYTWLADTTILEKTSTDLRILCEQSASSLEWNLILQKRLSMHLQTRRCSNILAGEIYRAMLAMPSSGAFPINELLSALGYDNMSTLDRGSLLAKIIIQLHSDKASAEQEVGRIAMARLVRIAEEDGQALLNDNFIDLWRQIKNLDYARNSLFARIMTRVQRRHSIKFDLTMLVLCLFGLVAVALLMTGLIFLSLCVSSSLVVLIVLFLVLLALSGATFWMMKDLLSNRKRR